MYDAMRLKMAFEEPASGGACRLSSEQLSRIGTGTEQFRRRRRGARSVAGADGRNHAAAGFGEGLQGRKMIVVAPPRQGLESDALKRHCRRWSWRFRFRRGPGCRLVGFRLHGLRRLCFAGVGYRVGFRGTGREGDRKDCREASPRGEPGQHAQSSHDLPRANNTAAVCPAAAHAPPPRSGAHPKQPNRRSAQGFDATCRRRRSPRVSPAPASRPVSSSDWRAPEPKKYRG